MKVECFALLFYLLGFEEMDFILEMERGPLMKRFKDDFCNFQSNFTV